MSTSPKDTLLVRALKRLEIIPLTDSDAQALRIGIFARLEKHPGTRAAPCTPALGKRLRKVIWYTLLMVVSVGCAAVAYSLEWAITAAAGGHILTALLVGVTVFLGAQMLSEYNAVSHFLYLGVCKLAAFMGMPMAIDDAAELAREIKRHPELQEACVRWVAYNQASMLTHAEDAHIYEATGAMKMLARRLEREVQERNAPELMQQILDDSFQIITRGKVLGQKDALEESTAPVATPHSTGPVRL